MDLKEDVQSNDEIIMFQSNVWQFVTIYKNVIEIN